MWINGVGFGRSRSFDLFHVVLCCLSQAGPSKMSGFGVVMSDVDLVDGSMRGIIVWMNETLRRWSMAPERRLGKIRFGVWNSFGLS